MSVPSDLHPGTGIPQALYLRARDLVEALPQRRNIRTEDIDPWLKAVFAREPDRLTWHIRRLRGIGGSEIGTCVAWTRGVFSFQNVKELFNEKLMMTPPRCGDGNTRRGLHLEEHIASEFHKSVGGERDTEALQALRTLPVDPRHPWVGGNINPDDIVVVRREKPRRILPDYKAPAGNTAFIYAKDGCPLEYEAQLHLYFHRAKGLAALGLGVDEMVLAPFSCDDWTIYPLQVPYRPEFEQEILHAGDVFWNEHVLKGLAPPLSFGPRDERHSVDISQRQAVLLARYASLRTMGNASLEQADEIYKQLTESIVRDNPQIENGRYAAGFVDVKLTRETSYAGKQLVEMAHKLGIHESAYTRPGKPEVDVEKLYTLVMDAAPNFDLPVDGLKREYVHSNVVLPRINGKSDRAAYLRETLKPNLLAFLESYATSTGSSLIEAFRPPTRGAAGADLTNPREEMPGTIPASTEMPEVPTTRVSRRAPAAVAQPPPAPAAESGPSNVSVTMTSDQLPIAQSNVRHLLRRPNASGKPRIA